jgi:hypothetical protein
MAGRTLFRFHSLHLLRIRRSVAVSTRYAANFGYVDALEFGR